MNTHPSTTTPASGFVAQAAVGDVSAAAQLVRTRTVGSHRVRSRATAPTGPDAVPAC